jgi:hypothetical protein
VTSDRSRCPNCQAVLHSTRFVCAECGWTKGDIQDQADYSGVDIGGGLKVSGGQRVTPIGISEDPYGDAA